MAKAFFSGYTGDPINSKRQLAPQASRGIPVQMGDASWRDFQMNGGPVVMTPGVIDRQAIYPGGQPLNPLSGKTVLGGGPIELGDVDPNDQGFLLAMANVFGHYSVALVATTTGVYRWRFSLGQATSAAAFLSLINFNDVLPQTRFHDLLLGGFTMAAAPDANFAVQVPLAVGGYTFAGTPVQVTGTASTLPIVRKTWPGNWNDADDADLWIKILTDNGDGTWEVQCGLSDSATPPVWSDTRTLTLGVPFRAYNVDGSRIGVKAEQPEVYLPVGATLVALDVFRVPRRQTIITQASSPSQAISSVNTSFIIDGEEIRVEGGWSLESAWSTLEGRPDTAGRQSATVRRAGQLAATMTPTRDLVDLTLQYAAHERNGLAVVMDAETDTEIEAGWPYRAYVVLPSCTPEGAMHDTESGGTNREESFALRAGLPAAALSYDGLSFAEHLEVVVYNARAAL